MVLVNRSAVKRLVAVFLFSLSSGGAWALVDTPRDAAMRDPVSVELENALANQDLQVVTAPLDYVALEGFYRQRGFRPAWCTTQGVNFNAQFWLAVLRQTDLQGTGNTWHLEDIHRLLNAVAPRECAALDLVLTDSFLSYVQAATRSELSPEDMDDKWYLSRPVVDAAQLLESTLQSGQFADAVATLQPQHAAYTGLRTQLSRYLAIQARGGWPQFAATGEKLEPGMESAEIIVLRDLLTVSGDLGERGEGAVYDAPLEQAVRRFQQRHGLTADGIIGKGTRAALAVPVQWRINQLRVNLARWHWLPNDLGDRYITVNSAAFELQVHEGDSVPLSMRVIVGKHERETPVFVEKMRYLVVNPYWYVPTSIAKRDLIPSILQDPEYLARKNIHVLSGWGASAEEVDPRQVAWRDYLGDRYLPYQLRQDPGPGNSLGRIKFMMPNQHSIYLHDTPSRNLFKRQVRAFSSGCIRVENPLALARYVLGDNSAAQQQLETVLASGDTQTLPLPEPIPVYLLYHTAWVDDENTVHFRDDIYQRDARLMAALPQLPAAAQVTQSVRKLPDRDNLTMFN